MLSIAPVRWATAADDAALRSLCRRTPMVGPVRYCLEREPDFFALTRLQGSAGGRIAVIDHDNAIVAMILMATQTVWVGGESRQAAYVGDLKVDPDHRHRGYTGRLVRFLADELRRLGISRSHFVVLAGNPAFARLARSSRRFQKLRSIRNFIVPFRSRRPAPSSHVIRRATPDAIPEMLALWNRLNRSRTFAPVLDEALLARWLSDTLSLGDFRLVRSNNSLVGFCAVWDASSIKQIRLLRLSPRLFFATRMYNIAAFFLGRPPFPRTNELLRFVYASHICAEDPEVLRSLLETVYVEHRNAGHLYIDLSLDPQDPLAEALAGFRPMKVDFDAWEAVTPRCPSAASGPDRDACAYFDMSLV
jgi:ribosomal protein S18 acetylase RimI-like enzyme